MMRHLFPRFLLLTLASAFPALAQINSFPTWEVGQPAPAFSAYDEKAVLHSLDEFKGKWLIFDVSTSWCSPSYLLAERIRLVKNALAAQSIPLASFTLVDQGPLGESLTGRGQALAWKQAFPESDVVVGHHIGFTEFLDGVPELRNLIGTTFNRKGFPLFVVIDPTGIIRYISRVDEYLESADDILALILPDQPPITEPPRLVTPTFYGPEIAPEVTVRVGRNWGRSRHPRIDAFSAGFVIPALEQGSLPHNFGIGFGLQPSPSQEIVSLYYDTHLPKDWSEPGIPPDQEVSFRLHIPRAKTPRPLVVNATAKVAFLNYVYGQSQKHDIPIFVQGNDLIVGPFRVGPSFYGIRAIDVSFVVARPDPSLLAVQSAEICLGFSPTNVSGPLLYSQWLAVENAANLPRTVAACDLGMERIRSLRRTVSRAPAADLSRAQRLAFLRIADEIRLLTLKEKIALRRAAKTPPAASVAR